MSEQTQGQDQERTVTRDDQPDKNDIICPFTLMVTKRRGKPVAQNYRCTWRATLEIEEDDGSVTVGGWECRPVTSGKYEDKWASDFLKALEALKKQLPADDPRQEWHGVYKFTHADGQKAMQEFIELAKAGKIKVINRENKRNGTYSWDRFVRNGAPSYDELKAMHPELYKNAGASSAPKQKERIKHVSLEDIELDMGDETTPPAADIIVADETEHMEIELESEGDMMSSEEETEMETEPEMVGSMGSGRQPMQEQVEETERKEGEGGDVSHTPGDQEQEKRLRGQQTSE